MSVTTPIESPNPYADAADLAAFWKELTEAEATRATSLLTLASNRLRTIGASVDVDTDAQANDTPAYFSTLQWVVMEATKRAMLTPMDLPPVETAQLTAGPYSENIKYSNPSGDLWFKKSELNDLGLYGKQSLSSLNTAQQWDIYAS